MGDLALRSDLSDAVVVSGQSKVDDFEQVRQLGMRYLQDAKSYDAEFSDLEACFAEGADFFKKRDALLLEYFGNFPEVVEQLDFPEILVTEDQIASAKDISGLEALTEKAWEVLQAVHVMRHKRPIEFNPREGIGVSVESADVVLFFEILEKVGRAIRKLLYSGSMALPGRQNVACSVGFLREGYEEVQKSSFQARMSLLQEVIAKNPQFSGINVKIALANFDVSHIFNR
jgi:hypothetical protein